MKLLRYGSAGQEKPGLLDSTGAIRDLSGVVPDLAGEVLLPASIARLSKIDPASLPRVNGTPRIGACVDSVSGVTSPSVGQNSSAIGLTP